MGKEHTYRHALLFFELWSMNVFPLVFLLPQIELCLDLVQQFFWAVYLSYYRRVLSMVVPLPPVYPTSACFVSQSLTLFWACCVLLTYVV